MTREQLLREIDAFLSRHKMTDYALGKAMGDGHLIRRIRQEALDPRLSTVAKINSAMEAMDKELANGGT